MKSNENQNVADLLPNVQAHPTPAQADLSGSKGGECAGVRVKRLVLRRSEAFELTKFDNFMMIAMPVTSIIISILALALAVSPEFHAWAHRLFERQ